MQLHIKQLGRLFSYTTHVRCPHYHMLRSWPFFPTKIHNTERVNIQRLLHLSTNAFDSDTALCLSEFGGPSVTSVKALNLASLIRTATSTLAHVKDYMTEFRQQLETHIPLKRFLCGKLWPAFFDSPAFAANLAVSAVF